MINITVNKGVVQEYRNLFGPLAWDKNTGDAFISDDSTMLVIVLMDLRLLFFCTHSKLPSITSSLVNKYRRCELQNISVSVKEFQ